MTDDDWSTETEDEPAAPAVAPAPAPRARVREEEVAPPSPAVDLPLTRWFARLILQVLGFLSCFFWMSIFWVFAFTLVGGGAFLMLAPIPGLICALALARVGVIPGPLFSGFTALLFWWWLSALTRPNTGAQTAACKSNLKDLATALEMYATDHHGDYPTHLGHLTPQYLRVIPTCMSTQSAAYSCEFHHVKPQGYTVFCSGGDHVKSGCSANYPQFSSVSGLREQ